MIPLTSYHLPITGYVNLPKLQAYQVTAASPGVVVKDLRNMGAMSHSCGLRQLNYCYIFGTSSSLLSLVTPLPHSTWFEFTVMPWQQVCSWRPCHDGHNRFCFTFGKAGCVATGGPACQGAAE